MTAFLMSPQHLAVLFGLFGQEPPLPVQESLAGIKEPEWQRLLGETLPRLTEGGVLARDAVGEAGLTTAAAELLAVCFEAECVVNVQPGDSPACVVYSRRDEAVAVAYQGDDIALASLSGTRAREEWLLSALGPSTATEAGEEFAYRLGTDDLEELLEAAFRQDHAQSALLAAKHGVDQQKVDEVLLMIGAEDAPLLAVAATRPGVPGTVMTRLRVGESGAWILKFVMLSDDDVAEVGWYPRAAVPALVSGFGDERDQMSGERPEEA